MYKWQALKLPLFFLLLYIFYFYVFIVIDNTKFLTNTEVGENMVALEVRLSFELDDGKICKTLECKIEIFKTICFYFTSAFFP